MVVESGKIPVDSEVPSGSSYEVYCDSKDVYDAMLNQVNFIKMILLKTVKLIKKLTFRQTLITITTNFILSNYWNQKVVVVIEFGVDGVELEITVKHIYPIFHLLTLPRKLFVKSKQSIKS